MRRDKQGGLAADILHCTFWNDFVISSTLANLGSMKASDLEAGFDHIKSGTRKNLSAMLAKNFFAMPPVCNSCCCRRHGNNTRHRPRRRCRADNGHVFVIQYRDEQRPSSPSFHNFEMGFMSRYQIHVAFISNNEQGRRPFARLSIRQKLGLG